MERKRVQFLVLLTFVVTIASCHADSETTPLSTTSSTTTTTTPSTTTTTASSTTLNTTTTSSTTPSTTELPITTTTESAITTTTTLPAPDPSVTEFKYYLRDPETGVACILANMSISMAINYVAIGFEMKVGTLNVPSEVEVRGTCSGKVPTMELIWTEEPTTEDRLNGIALMFHSKDSTFFLYGIAVDVYLDEKNFPDALRVVSRFATEVNELNEFTASQNGGLYRCASETEVCDRYINITISDVALIAYNTEKSVASRIEENCAAVNVAAIAGGVVGGVVLIGIIVAVIVIWRKKRRQD